MKKTAAKMKGLAKGAPTGVLVSAGIHLLLLLGLGGMVVFSVVMRPEKKFVPPAPTERPKMQLLKPKVKVEKTVKPGSTKRIVSKVVANVPEMQLPALDGMGDGLGTGIGGFELMPDTSGMSLFGGRQSVAIGNDFEGTFYAIGLDPRGRRNGIGSGPSYYMALRPFFEMDWNPRALSVFYRAPHKLYATFFYIPMSASEMVPRGFGIPDSIYSMQWVALYTGKIMSPRDKPTRFRFWGRAENLMAVRIDGKEVLQAGHMDPAEIVSDWRSTADEHRKYWRGHGPMGVGDWFELQPGVPVKMEVIFGDENGVWTQATLTIEEEGVEYPKNQDGAPILPVFKTAEIPEFQIDEIKHAMIEGEADLYSPLMFNVY
jgi:hypothetical protein